MNYIGPLTLRHIRRFRTVMNRVVRGIFKTEWEEATEGKINLDNSVLYNVCLHEI